MTRIVWFSFILICSQAFFISVTAQKSNLKKVTFIPQWSPQAQFAGYYVAYEKGIYEKYGIDLNIIRGDPDSPSTDYLKNGKSDIATMFLSTAITGKAKGVDLINIAQIVQRSALMLITKKSSMINDPKDMDGKKVSLWGPESQLQARALFKKYDVDPKIIPHSHSINLFLRDGVDVASAMWYNEYHTIINHGVNPDELTTFFFHDYNLNFPEDGIYILKESFEKDPTLSCAFVKASIEGWEYAFDHPDEAIDIVIKYMREANIPANRVHQKWMLERMEDLIIPDREKTRIGELNVVDFNRVTTELYHAGLVEETLKLSDFSMNCN